jgi:hypothetical protein
VKFVRAVSVRWIAPRRSFLHRAEPTADQRGLAVHLHIAAPRGGLSA